MEKMLSAPFGCALSVVVAMYGFIHEKHLEIIYNIRKAESRQEPFSADLSVKKCSIGLSYSIP